MLPLQVALCALARLYLMNDDLDQCQYTCMTLLRNDKDNEEATVMMADLAFRKNDYEAAMFHFQQLLEKRPDYWVALARLVEVMRRTGHLEEVLLIVVVVGPKMRRVHLIPCRFPNT